MKKKRLTMQVLKKRFRKAKELTKLDQDPFLSDQFDKKKLRIYSLLNKCSKDPICKEQILGELLKFNKFIVRIVEVVNNKDVDPIFLLTLQREFLVSLDTLASILESKIRT